MKNMIKINDAKINLAQLNQQKQELINLILNSASNTLLNEMRLLLKDNVNISNQRIITDIIGIEDFECLNLNRNYKVREYIELSYIVDLSVLYSRDLDLRKNYINDILRYIGSNSDVKGFLPNYAFLQDEDYLSYKINNKVNFMKFMNEEIFNTYINFNIKCKQIFNYNEYITNYRANILRAINTLVCPYCNITLIHDLSNGGILGDLDHYYLQSKFPLFGLSFGNFIPSCAGCNRVLKNQKIAKILNPRKNEFGQDAVFKIENILELQNGNTDLIRLDFKIDDESAIIEEIQNSLEVFDLKVQYNHTSVINTIYSKYNATRVLTSGMEDYWRKVYGTDDFERVYEKLLGFKPNETNFSDLSYGKLMYDIFNERYFKD